jgi:hypothetical protein
VGEQPRWLVTVGSRPGARGKIGTWSVCRVGEQPRWLVTVCGEQTRRKRQDWFLECLQGGRTTQVVGNGVWGAPAVGRRVVRVFRCGCLACSPSGPPARALRLGVFVSPPARSRRVELSVRLTAGEASPWRYLELGVCTCTSLIAATSTKLSAVALYVRRIGDSPDTPSS